MEIFLVRHTTPDVAKGVCYGQADIGVTDSFHSEASEIRKYVPTQVAAVYSSPLQRCRLLAEYLYGEHPLQLYDELKEIDCGQWELQRWDDIPRTEIDPWMNDLVNVRTRGGESYTDLYLRVHRIFEQIHRQELPAVLVAHGGVIRSILSHITGTALTDSFKVFSLHYGCVIRLYKNDGWRYEVLFNPFREKETHKPSNL